MSGQRRTFADADARIAKALGLIDEWLRDESEHDGLVQRLLWGHVREIRAALDPGDLQRPDEEKR